MTGRSARRPLTWLVLLLYLAALVFALVLIWTSADRIWYIRGAGIDVTLDMTFETTARWLATAVLGGLVALGLLALLMEARAARRRPAAPAFTPSLAETPVRGSSGTEELPPVAIGGSDPAPVASDTLTRYDSVIVGDEVTQRMEQSVPRPTAGPNATEGEQAGWRRPAGAAPVGRSADGDGSSAAQGEPPTEVLSRPTGPRQ